MNQRRAVPADASPRAGGAHDVLAGDVGLPREEACCALLRPPPVDRPTIGGGVQGSQQPLKRTGKL